MWIAILLSMALSFVGGALIERVLIRPVEQASPLVLVIVTIGMFLALNSIAQVQFGTDIKQPAPRLPEQDVAPRACADLRRHARARRRARSSSACRSTCCCNARSSGSRCGAVASNPESSRLVGIPVGRMLMLGWGLAAALGALAGALVVAAARSPGRRSMQSILVFAFAAAALGGFDSPLAARSSAA